MRLSTRLADKIEAAINKLPILQIEKDQFDFEITAGRLQDPNGGPGGVTVYRLVLFAPAVGNDHTTNETPAIIWDPYMAAEEIDRMVADLYAEILAEQRAAQDQEVPAELRTPQLGAISAALADPQRSPGGLFRGR
jgi:hypothetical protein